MISQERIPIERRLRIRLLLTLVMCCGTPAGLQASDPPQVSFARQVLPILSNKCFVCHGPDAEEGMLRLDSFELATQDRGGYRAIAPGSTEEQTVSDSELRKRIHSEQDPMPPADAEQQLTPEERSVLDQWISQGGRYDRHWAFVPPKKLLPVEAQALQPSAVVDALIRIPLDARQVQPAPKAERHVLARRAALTLTGLPPEPQALSAFLHDPRPDAFQHYVDGLLSSQRFGENQAHYWLDAVRYGDTHGLHLDNRRGIYPYRDWVIYAFNNNLPLDQFITWQIAGDLLPEPSLEQLVATGYVRMNPTTSEGGVIPAEFQAKNNFDRTETLGTVFLGMTLTCARCHTHKYDPIQHEEYYKLFAFFNSTQESPLDGNKYDYAPTIRAPRDLQAWSRWRELQKQRDELLAESKRQLEKVNVAVDASLKGLQKAEPDRQLDLLEQLGPNLAEMQSQLSKLNEMQTEFTTTLVAAELKEPRTTQVLSRGEYDLPIGEPLTPDVPLALGSFPSDAPRNRLGLAQWITARDNPLVARVLVNRLWQQVFGHGLVRTPEDFGLQGQQPTHPELLDWLAEELHDSQWDLKHMLRLMLLSETFQQSSAWRPNLDDPENRLFAAAPAIAWMPRSCAILDCGLVVCWIRIWAAKGSSPISPRACGKRWHIRPATPRNTIPTVVLNSIDAASMCIGSVPAHTP